MTENLSYVRKCSQDGLCSLDKIRERDVMIEEYKILHGCEDVDSTKLFTLSSKR